MRAIIILFIVFSSGAFAQTLPREGSRLNFSIVGFTIDGLQPHGSYILEIADGYYERADSFQKHKILSKTTGIRATARVPAFGRTYTWRMFPAVAGISKASAPLHHFSISSNRRLLHDLRLHILDTAVHLHHYYVTSDDGSILYDLSGAPVWYLPDTNGFTGYVSNLRYTHDSTVTFLHYTSAYETDFAGKIMWRSPGIDIVTNKPAAENYYHHEFVKTTKGSYMVLGTELCKCRIADSEGKKKLKCVADLSTADGYKLARFGDIIEYDKSGRVLWQWQSSGYFMKSDFASFRPLDTTLQFEPHDNSFYFDEKRQEIFLGFRNFNRIVCIAYPSGRVLDAIGEHFQTNTNNADFGLCNQHGVTELSDGSLACFNNNSCTNTDSAPVVLVFNKLANGNYHKTWSFACPVAAGVPLKFTRGGNVMPLPQHNLFVCMGGNYSKLMIVNHNKKILWSALPEKFSATSGKWEPGHSYRGFIIAESELDALVWKSETD